MNYIYAKWKWKKQCFDIIEQRISAKNMNNDFVIFRDKIKIFLILWFERRDRDLCLLHFVLRDEIENLFHQVSNFETGTRF